MAEAGGGRLHDAEVPREIGEVVLGELLEGRAALLERTTLRIAVPANLRAEVVGAWSHTILHGAIEVLVGSLLPDTPKRVVVRLHCPAGAPGTVVRLGASAAGALPDGSAFAYKVDDGHGRARMPLTLAVLQRMGVEWSSEHAALAAPAVLGGGARVGIVRAIPGVL